MAAANIFRFNFETIDTQCSLLKRSVETSTAEHRCPTFFAGANSVFVERKTYPGRSLSFSLAIATGGKDLRTGPIRLEIEVCFDLDGVDLPDDVLENKKKHHTRLIYSLKEQQLYCTIYAYKVREAEIVVYNC